MSREVREVTSGLPHPSGASFYVATFGTKQSQVPLMAPLSSTSASPLEEAFDLLSPQSFQ